MDWAASGSPSARATSSAKKAASCRFRKEERDLRQSVCRRRRPKRRKGTLTVLMFLMVLLLGDAFSPAIPVGLVKLLRGEVKL